MNFEPVRTKDDLDTLDTDEIPPDDASRQLAHEVAPGGVFAGPLRRVRP